MSNIRDLQKLRGTKNVSVFAQTAYHSHLNPEQKRSFNDNYLERSPILTSRSPKKHPRDLEEPKSPSPSRILHRRGGSFGLGLHEDKNSLIFQNPRVSIYNMSMKLGDPKSRQSYPQCPSPTPKERDTFFQMNEVQLTRKRSSKPSSPLKNPEVNKKMFNVLYPIGKGGFGKVWKVEFKKNRGVYAMKEMSKVKIINKKSVTSVMNQKEFLTRLNHPFIVNIRCAFQDRQNLYLVMDYLDGGDLRYHLGNKRVFNERQTKFFIANMLIGLEYIHKNKIIHRDIKPENLVLDSEGYMRITDLGISREYRQNNSNDTSGTPGYMAPEVMCRKDHSFTVDYFAVGVIAYEFMLGKRPYLGRDRREIKENMLAKQAAARIDQLPYKWSPHAIDFINKLLLRNPNARLGAAGIEQIKEHPWLQDVQWERLLARKIKAPFRPISIEEDYESYKEQISEDTLVENQEETMLMLRDQQTQTLFEGYHYEKEELRDRRSTSYATSYTTHTEENNFKRR